MFYVYKIKVNGITRYIGYTNNPQRRQKEHIRDYQTGKDKYLYRMTRESAPETIYEVLIVKEFKTKSDAKRWEAVLILIDYFGKKLLWQSPPVAFNYY